MQAREEANAWLFPYFPGVEGQVLANDVVVNVPWSVHFGIQLELDMRVGDAVVQATRVPRQLPRFLQIVAETLRERRERRPPGGPETYRGNSSAFFGTKGG